MSAETAGVDPFARTSTTKHETIARWARVALAWSVIYVVWRAAFTLSGADALAGGLLLIAEVLAVGVFAARARSAHHGPIEVVASPDAPFPDLAAVIDATGTSIDELRTTLVAMRRVSGVDRVIVVDRQGSRWLRTIAERFDATVVEPSVSFDEAVVSTGTSWVLLMRSGDLPMPDLVSVCAPRCSSPDVAVIQVGIEEADPTSFEHDPDGQWSLEPFEQQVVRPGLAAQGSIPWFGDGPALVRRGAVAALESVGNGHMLDRSHRVGLDLIRNGMTVTQLPLTLARVRGTHGLGESLQRRHRRAVSALAVLRPSRLRGISRPAQFAHLAAAIPVVAALQRVALIAAALLILGLGRTPMETDAVLLALLAIPSYVLRWSAHLLLGRGRLGVFSILRSDLRSLGVDLVPFVRLHSPAGRGGLGALSVGILALGIGVVVSAVSIWRDWPDRLAVSAATIALMIAAGFLGVAVEVLLDALARGQRRVNRRVRLGLVTCRIEEQDGLLVDLSTGGAGVVLAEPDEGTLASGEVTTISFRIPDADGAWRNVSALVHIAHRSHDPEGGVRLGLSFDDPADAPLDPVVEFLTIDRRLVALGRHEVVSR